MRAVMPGANKTRTYSRESAPLSTTRRRGSKKNRACGATRPVLCVSQRAWGHAMISDGRLERFRKTKTYDLLTALPLMAWFGLGTWNESQQILQHVRRIASDTEDLLGALQLLAIVGSVTFGSLLIITLLVRTVPRARSSDIWSRVLAVTGTFLGTGFLYLHAIVLPMWLQAIADILIVAGNVLSILVLFRLGKSFAIMAEARVLVTDGPYRIVRHPLYVVEQLGSIAMLMQFFGPAAIAFTVGQIAVQVAIAFFEERILAKTFPEYRAYQARTWRFIPYVI